MSAATPAQHRGAVAVSCRTAPNRTLRGVEEVDAELARLAYRARGLVLVDLTPVTPNCHVPKQIR